MINKHNAKIKIDLGLCSVSHTSALIDGYGILALNNCKQREIGTSEDFIPTIKSTLNSDVVLSFSKVKSIEVLILKLQEIRGLMLGYSIEDVEDYKLNLHDITDAYEPNSKIDVVY